LPLIDVRPVYLGEPRKIIGEMGKKIDVQIRECANMQIKNVRCREFSAA
jgi:hypothetical protein